MERAARIAPITSLQPPFSLLRREIEPEILPWCRAHDVGVLAYSPLASGLLTGTWSRERRDALPEDDWRKHKNPLFQDPAFARHLAVVEAVRGIAATRGVAPGAVALAWVLAHPAITGAIVGARRGGQFADLAVAAALELTAEERGVLVLAAAGGGV
jgi:aryl-alcohol dehydrogenase-like predicted oxidoreductase